MEEQSFAFIKEWFINIKFLSLLYYSKNL